MSPTVSEPARWELRWPEVAVLDGNAAALGIEEASLMDSAGKALATTALEMTDSAVLVLCGPGNNGGDGFVAARYLREWGVEVSVLASHASAGTDVCIWPERPSGEWALVVDCLLGAGASGPGYSLRGQIKDIAAWAADLGLPVLACDIPTGLGGPDALQADTTITFHSMKQGLDSPDSGDITVVPLPWPAEVEDCGPGRRNSLPDTGCFGAQGRPRQIVGHRRRSVPRRPPSGWHGRSAQRLRPGSRGDAERGRGQSRVADDSHPRGTARRGQTDRGIARAHSQLIRSTPCSSVGDRSRTGPGRGHHAGGIRTHRAGLAERHPSGHRR